MQRCCFNCEFFQVDGKECAGVTEEDWDEGRAVGECRLNPPVVGDPAVNLDGEEFRLFGEYPRVVCTDWCGQFKGRVVSGGQPNTTVRRTQARAKSPTFACGAIGS